jgi:hypothetical protein
MSKLEERESRRRSATVGKFVEQPPMAATSSRSAGPAEGGSGAEEAD